MKPEDYVTIVAAIALRDGGSTRIPTSYLELIKTDSVVAVTYDRETNEVVVEVMKPV